MLDRIRRKLFLSLKIMGSTDGSPSSENTTLGSAELLSILRKGSGALTATDIGMDITRFLDAKIADVLEESRSLEKSRGVKIKRELKVEEGMDCGNEKLLLDAEEEERRLLSGIAQVQSRLFEGKVVQSQQTNSEIANEWQDLSKRARVDRTIVVDGMTFIAMPPASATVSNGVILRIEHLPKLVRSWAHQRLSPSPERSLGRKIGAFTVAMVASWFFVTFALEVNYERSCVVLPITDKSQYSIRNVVD